MVHSGGFELDGYPHFDLHFRQAQSHVSRGDVADHNIKAKFELLIEDEQSTQKKREEAAQESPWCSTWTAVWALVWPNG